jgi:hypothetical protein
MFDVCGIERVYGLFGSYRFLNHPPELNRTILPTSRVSSQLWPAASTMYRTASPLNGAVKDIVDPPLVAATGVVTPVAGLNHSTFSASSPTGSL